MFLSKKEDQVRRLVADHMEQAQRCLWASRDALMRYLENDQAACERLWHDVQAFEHQGDIIRREIYALLDKGAFLPLLRADLHRFIERMDDVAGVSEDVADTLLCEHPVVPEAMVHDLQEVFSKTLEQMAVLADAATCFVRNDRPDDRIREKIVQILATEHEIDELEHALTRWLFASSLTLAEKLHLKKLLTQVAEISNKIEDVADGLSEIIVKMQV
jgi:predicted phosphate transport protein (TIGR00153 family)